MSKEKTGEIKKPPAQGADHGHAPAKPTGSGGGGKGGAGAKVGCHAAGCKDKDVRFNFCNEHFRQFKFGLITKTGDPVLDYEKKYEHYHKWLKAQKVA
jgi:hypothetical protein